MKTLELTFLHTPGPWEIGKHATPDYAPQYGVYSGESSADLAIVKGNRAKADAQLIAAAPELLVALVECHQELIELTRGESCDHDAGICYCETFAAMDAAKSAIEKAIES